VVLDRESGKEWIIENPLPELSELTDYYFFFRTNYDSDSIAKLNQLLQCLWILQSLPESALDEATSTLKLIADFYLEYSPQANLHTISPKQVKGKLRATKLRPPIVLE